MFKCSVENNVLVLGKWVPFHSVIECRDKHELNIIKDLFAGKVVQIQEVAYAK